ncbi:FKBP-type peptidyl-prolyl cis-trans isomerase [Streptomyces sp. NPDC051909]|uniref:FKBP-type peptidyl-prolyl cis-trans isomerase n=1 Tax=Streptomyces sp. NPDC051909 TaxID=3154944 RepID=UPI00343F5144
MKGEIGKRAVIELPPGSPPVDRFVVSVVSEGKGPAVRDKDWVTLGFSAKDWSSRTDLPSTYDAGQAPQIYQLGSGRILGFDRALVGHRVGSRVLVIGSGSAAFGARASTGSAKMIAAVIDIASTVHPDSSVVGKERQPASGIPQVRGKGERAEIAVPESAEPSQLLSHVLVEGSGPRVQPGQNILVQYSGFLWKSGKKFDSSWKRGGAVGFQIGTGRGMKAWDQGLVGRAVGSRLMLVAPPSFAYGDKPPRGVPAGSTVIFVIDILQAA